MTTLNEIENAVKGLGPRELSEFQEWFAKFQAEKWDFEFEDDVRAGRLDALAKQAIDDD